MGCGKVPVRLADVPPLIGRRVQDLDVGSEIPVAPELAELVEILVGHIRDVKLVVSLRVRSVACADARCIWTELIHTDSQQVVVVELVKDFIRILAIGRRGIRETGSVVQIAYMIIYINKGRTQPQ